MPTDAPTLAAASRMLATVSRCISCVPCEKLIRTTFTPAFKSCSSTSAELLAGPSVATIFVRLVGITAGTSSSSSAASQAEGVLAEEAGVVAQVRLYAEQTVVLRGAVAAARRAGLDLAGVDANREVGDEGVLGLAAAVRDHVAVAVALGQLDGVHRLRQAADLVDLD